MELKELHPADIHGKVIANIKNDNTVTYLVEYYDPSPNDEKIPCTATVHHVPGHFDHITFTHFEDAYIASFIGGYAKTEENGIVVIDGVDLTEKIKYIKAILYAEDV